MAKILFKEKQYLRKTSGFFVVVFIGVAVLLIFFVKFLHQMWNEEAGRFINAPDSKMFVALLIVMLFVLYIIILAFISNLEVWVTEKGIGYKYAPFVKKCFIRKETIQHYRIKKGKELQRFRNSGFQRIVGVKQRAYVIKGQTAVLLYLTNGDNILLGTQKPKIFIKALERIKKIETIKNG